MTLHRRPLLTQRVVVARRAYHHGDLRAALLKAALELVQKDGAAGFSLREAARKVGVDAAASYRHFRDRQELLIALAQDGFAELARAFAVERARSKKKPARQRLKALAKVYLAFALAHPAEFRIMFGESGLHSRDVRLRPPGEDESAYEQLEEAVAEYLRAERGTETKAAELALVLWAGVHGVTRLILDGAVPLDDREAATLLEALISGLLGGLKKRPALLENAPRATRDRSSRTAMKS